MKANEEELRARLGAALKAARVAKGLTQAELAEAVETDPETVSRFERGATLPSLVRLLSLADALDVTVASLLGGASPRPQDVREELSRALSSLSPRDSELAVAVLQTVVSLRGAGK